MFSVIFWVCVGVLIGWNLPQPRWAKDIQDKAVAAIKSIGAGKGPGSY